jgi:hypothetical protein
MSCFRVPTFFTRSALVAIILFVIPTLAPAKESITEAERLLPDKIESFHGTDTARPPSGGLTRYGDELLTRSQAERNYANDVGASFVINLTLTANDSAAYALLAQPGGGVRVGGVGTASAIGSDFVGFCKGSTFVRVTWTHPPADSQNQLLSIAQAFAATLPGGDEGIPVLVMHLPDWQNKVDHSGYAVTLAGLKLFINQPVLDEISFDGGTEAVTAKYGEAEMVIVEFTTPQFSVDNDQRIAAKIQRLKSQGRPTPSAYRRVGNYSVFVFNAKDEKSANDLIDQVQYQQVVQWLGDDPHMADRLQRYFSRTTAGVLIAVLKSSGLSLILCLGIGALFGALLFRHRRSQQATLYSDAGGAVRLNLDQLTDPGNSRRLLQSGKQPGSDTTQS